VNILLQKFALIFFKALSISKNVSLNDAKNLSQVLSISTVMPTQWLKDADLTAVQISFNGMK
jgi:hypothetical protein